jgi:nucleoside-diphosphate-sugar epimerase
MLVRDLCAIGRTAWVMHRTDERREEFERLGAITLIGDAMDRDSILRATEQAAVACDAIVNLIGGNPMQPPDTWPDYGGNVNAIDAAASAGIRRIVFVTSVGTGSSWQYVPEDAFTRPILELKSRAEAHLRDSGLSYCIIKPGGLWHGEEVRDGDAVLVTENDSVRGVIDRTQLVEVIKQVLDDKSGVTDGKELYAVAYKVNVLDGNAEPFDFRRG